VIKKTELDKPCEHIFQFLIANFEGIGFNELRKKLKDNDYSMSPPTLSKHLKQHLVKELKLVTFERKGIQGINYRINHKIYERAKKIERLNEFLEEGKTEFYAKSLEQQIKYVSNIMTIKNLEELRTFISTVVEPEKTFENNLKLIMLKKSFNDIFEKWFLVKCKEDTNYGKQAIIKIDELLTSV
jgi:DNA-binding transcriptional ArsR family regulator